MSVTVAGDALGRLVLDDAPRVVDTSTGSVVIQKCAGGEDADSESEVSIPIHNNVWEAKAVTASLVISAYTVLMHGQVIIDSNITVTARMHDARPARTLSAAISRYMHVVTEHGELPNQLLSMGGVQAGRCSSGTGILNLYKDSVKPVFSHHVGRARGTMFGMEARNSVLFGPLDGGQELTIMHTDGNDVRVTHSRPLSYNRALNVEGMWGRNVIVATLPSGKLMTADLRSPNGDGFRVDITPDRSQSEVQCSVSVPLKGAPQGLHRVALRMTDGRILLVDTEVQRGGKKAVLESTDLSRCTDVFNRSRRIDFATDCLAVSDDGRQLVVRRGADEPMALVNIDDVAGQDEFGVAMRLEAPRFTGPGTRVTRASFMCACGDDGSPRVNDRAVWATYSNGDMYTWATPAGAWTQLGSIWPEKVRLAGVVNSATTDLADPSQLCIVTSDALGDTHSRIEHVAVTTFHSDDA